MADDHNQRPYRTNGPAGTAPTAASGSDPLAELARLIGQNDPFSEFGRQPGARAPAPAPAPDWPPQHHADEPEAEAPPPAQPYGAPVYGRQSLGNDLYQVDPAVPVYGEPLSGGVPGYTPDAAGFEQDAYRRGQADSYAPPFAAPFPASDAEHDEFYDDVPPSRRRIGILAIAAVFALAVIGTAGAFGYRAIFGSSSTSGPPPVIKADTAPSKIVPAAAGKDTQASKMITDRVNERGQGEKLVSREEQPVPVTASGAAVSPNSAPGGANGSGLPQLGSGIVGADPKRVRTIVIHQDGSAAAPSEPEPQPAAAPPPQRIANPAPAPAPAPQQRPAPPPVQAAPRQVPQAAPQPAPQPAPRAVANAPLSLNPNAEAAPRQAAPVQRTAAAAAPTRPAPAAASRGGGYAVQVSSQRSEADAQSAFRGLQAKFPSQLGGKPSLIKRVDLGAKGIYFRAMVGPFGSSNEASELCASLKSAGGNCLVQRN